jgi:hypothetical protein
MRRVAASLALGAAHQTAPARPAVDDGGPDRDAFLGTWLETLQGHQCNDVTTVRVRDGELWASSKACAGGAVYETESVRSQGHELELSFREASSGALFRYHLTQRSRRELTGELEIADGEPRVFPVTWTKPR